MSWSLSKMPEVSVVMAVHDGGPYIRQAVESILAQSFRDFEFLIIDDASKDSGSNFLSGLTDERVRLIAHSHQAGLSRSLNEGIQEAKGKYLARMDHDDISLSDRLQKQVNFLDAHQDVDVLGTWARTLGLAREQTWRYPIVDEDIRSEFAFNSSLVHSSVMLRTATLERLQLRYDDSTLRAQDYELWTREESQIRFANLGSVLIRYRVHADQVGSRYAVEQQAAAEKIRLREIERLGVKPTTDEFNLHNRISRWEHPEGRAELLALQRWFLKLRAANQTSQTYSMDAFDRTLERRWWAACKANIWLGLEARQIYRDFPFRGAAQRGFLEKAQLLAKAILRELGWGRR